jgi:predicted ribosomally synthesized peptide with SipW-like signal peptide
MSTTGGGGGPAKHGSPRWQWAVLAAVLALVAGAGGTNALLSDSSSVGANAFTTKTCFGTQLKSMQSGTAVSNANGTQTVPISSVDTTKAFLLFDTRHNSNRPVGSALRGRVASATTLEFVRVTNEVVPVAITIQWQVVEYLCGVNVQRGQVSQTTATVNVAITPVASLSQAFVTWSKTTQNTDNTWDQDNAGTSALTSTSNLQFQSVTANANVIVWWQVIEFTKAAEINVQSGNTTLTGAAVSTTVTLGTAVNLARTFVLVDYTTSGTGADIGARMVRARLTGTTTLVIDRSVSGTPDALPLVHWQVVELKDGSKVQGGNASLASGASTIAVPIAAVNLTKATAFLSVQAGAGQGIGRTPYVADDVLGVSSFTTALASTTLTLQRANTASTADVGWFVVEWGP